MRVSELEYLLCWTQVTLSDLTLCLDEQEKGSSHVAHFQVRVRVRARANPG